MPTHPSSGRSSRRSFIVTAGTALSAPIAAAAATVPGAAPDADDPRTRLARLEAVEAIRALNQNYARSVNAGERDALAALFVDPAAAAVDAIGTARIDGVIRRISTEGLADDDAIELAPDLRSATGRLHRVVDTEDAIGPSCPLVEMAREQGGGVVRRTERVRIESAYVRRDGAWKIQRATVLTTAVLTTAVLTTAVLTTAVLTTTVRTAGSD